VETHPVTFGVFTVLVGSLLWLRKLLKQKRAEAFFGFYSRLDLLLRNLKACLSLKDDMPTTPQSQDTTAVGNIFCLLYSVTVRAEICSGFVEPTEDEKAILREILCDIKEAILETDCNVYPKRCKKEKWGQSQYVLLEFYRFINKGEKVESYKTKESAMKDKRYIHIEKYDELITAIQFLQTSIHKATY
jgi:hypothetical protein